MSKAREDLASLSTLGVRWERAVWGWGGAISVCTMCLLVCWWVVRRVGSERWRTRARPHVVCHQLCNCRVYAVVGVPLHLAHCLCAVLFFLGGGGGGE